jgi:hypothetical protein
MRTAFVVSVSAKGETKAGPVAEYAEAKLAWSKASASGGASVWLCIKGQPPKIKKSEKPLPSKAAKKES